MSNERMPRQKSASSQSHSDFAIARNRVAAQTSATMPKARRWRGVSAGGGWVCIFGCWAEGLILHAASSAGKDAAAYNPAIVTRHCDCSTRASGMPTYDARFPYTSELEMPVIGLEAEFKV